MMGLHLIRHVLKLPPHNLCERWTDARLVPMVVGTALQPRQRRSRILPIKVFFLFQKIESKLTHCREKTTQPIDWFS